MSTVTDMIDDFIEGRQTLSQTMTKFEKFDWSKPRKVDETDVEGSAPTENSFDEVQTDSRLTVRQYAQLAEAYRRGVGGQGG